MTFVDFPEAFLERLKLILSEGDFASVCSQLGRRERTIFRINPLKADLGRVKNELDEAGIEFVSVDAGLLECFEVSGKKRRELTETKAFYEGAIFIQNPSSQLAAVVLQPEPGEEVLDLAAAPGGKTIHLAGLMRNEGFMTAVEVIKGRFYKLKGNLERCGATMVDSQMMDGRAAGKRWPGRFDRVLLDAPCSSEARFKKGDAKSWEHWSPRKIKETSRKQKRLILAAFDALKPGGTLLYSTCSFAPEENEGIVQSLIKRVGDAVEVLPIPLDLPHARSG
ncbi:MAG: RsmB/NOP family class I SAM-dependent RNA methyltransferase, partial [Verrucomicrobiota bacterium]